MKELIPSERIERAILLIHGQKIMLDTHLAELYGVETKVLNRAVKRNLQRFLGDFMFQLSYQEVRTLRCQLGTSNIGRGDDVTYPMPSLNTERSWPRTSSIQNAPSRPAYMLSVRSCACA